MRAGSAYPYPDPDSYAHTYTYANPDSYAHSYTGTTAERTCGADWRSA